MDNLEEKVRLFEETADWIAQQMELIHQEMKNTPIKDIRNNKSLRQLMDHLLSKTQAELREGKKLINEITSQD